MKVLQVVGQLCVGGQETMAKNFYEYIDREHFDFDYVVYGEEIGEYEAELEEYGAHIFHVTYSKNIFSYIKQMFLIIKNGKYDVVHSHTYTNNGLVLSVAKFCHVPNRISHCHTTESGKNNSLLYSLYHTLMRKIVLASATDYIACGEKAGEMFYGKQMFNQNGIVLKNGIDLKKYKFNQTIRNKIRAQYQLDDFLVCGTVSRIEPVKNHGYLIKIAKRMKLMNLPVKFMVVGDGSLLSTLKNECMSEGVFEEFLFLGQRNDSNELLNAMDVFLQPSIFEGVPLAVIEAQANGLPCVVSNNVSEEVKINPNVVLLSISDQSVLEWCEQIDQFSHKERYCNNDKLIEAGYDIRVTCKKLERIYFNEY